MKVLNTEEINKLIDKIVLVYQPEKIILFGSYAIGNANTDSDVDLLIIKQTHLPRLKRGIEARKMIDYSIVPMDYVILTPDEYNQNKESINHIANIATKTGRLLYDNSKLH